MRLFTTSLVMAGIALSMHPAAFAQVGPPQPTERQKQSLQQESTPSLDKVKDSFKKLFTPQDTGEEEEVEYVEERRGAGIPGQFDTVKVKKPTSAEQEAKAAEAAAKMKQMQRPPMLSAPPLKSRIEQPEVSDEDPPVKLPTLDNAENPLGYAHAQKRLNTTASLIDEKHMHSAKSLLVPLKEWLVESTEAHIGLYKALNKIPSARVQAEVEKQVALEFAMLRDIAFFQLGKIHVAENDHREAVRVLTEVVKSQPRSEIGLKAYEMLQEIGFTQKLQLVE